MKHISKTSYGKIRDLYNEGFSILELAIMYETSVNKIERVLENENDY